MKEENELILSPVQIKWINAEVAETKRIVVEKEKTENWKGLGGDKIYLDNLRTIIKLHNLEVDAKETGSKENVKRVSASAPILDLKAIDANILGALSFGC